MSIEDEAARKARAKRIRADIDAMTGTVPPEETAAAEPPAATPKPESPRDFVQRRMREVAEAEKKKPDASA